jgi:DNA (cytosine-5)-methyltransferase 1
MFSTIVTEPNPYWGAFIHPYQDRVLSVREFARAQSFPDKVKLFGTLRSQYRQVGNAVPCLLAHAIATEVKKSFGQ